MTAGGIDVGHLSVWTLRGLALISVGLLALAGYRLMSPTVRRTDGLSSLGAIGVLALLMLLTRGRAILWYTTICLAALALSLLTMGRMPADMPSARDPACRSHPEYATVARRGLIATGLTVVLAIVAIALSARYVHGL